MCEQCTILAEQNHALQERAVEEFEKREAMVNRLAKADREIAGLKGELTKLRTDSPKMKDAEEVARFWMARLHKNARTTFGPERQKKVLARLKEKSLTPDGDRKDDLKWAIRGCEALPFVGSKGRQPSGGGGAKRYDDLALICRDETSVERFISYADDRAMYVFSRFVGLLGGAVGDRLDVFTDEAGGPIMVVAVCPVCGVDWGLAGLPGQAWVGELLSLRCRSGCSAAAVKDRLRGGGSAGLAVAA